jgi:copper transport protein
VLERAEPAPNAQLPAAPAEIRLWFTEPLEAKYSGFELRNAQGAVVETAPSLLDTADPHQLVMQPGELPDGLYTVVWSNVSAADGHHSEGSFPFTIGAATFDQAQNVVVEESIPPGNSFIRWFNLLSLSLLIGSLGFVLFVWRPALTIQVERAERRLRKVIWIGWFLVGIAGMLLLWMQTVTVTNVAFQDALDFTAIQGVVLDTRFGTLWLSRMALWLLIGALLLLARRHRAFNWLGLGCGMALLLLNSLFSHSAAVQDSMPSIWSDWLHLLMTALWVGGLAQFFVVIQPLRRAIKPAAPVLGQVVGYFSIYARIAVIALIVTGFYALWLHVGSVEALLTTVYGRLLVIKLILVLPLLAVAFINLMWTHRRLLAGRELWVGRLRSLVGIELLLTLAVLAVVGAMTSINPARNEMAIRAAAAAVPPAPQPQPIAEMQMADDLHVQLTITPGWVGDNSFQITLSTMEGEPVTDASLIRLRFEHQEEDLGQSELRITESAEGAYSVRGANLSAPGDWRIRMTVQRPEQYDSVIDFAPHVELAPPPPPGPVVEVATTLPYGTTALALTGVLLLSFGGYFLGQQRFRFWQGVGVLASLLITLGCLLLVSAV